MAKVIMLEDCKGSPNGVTTVQFKKGGEYNLPPDLAEVFVDEMEVAEVVEVVEADEVEDDEDGDETE